MKFEETVSLSYTFRAKWGDVDNVLAFQSAGRWKSPGEAAKAAGEFAEHCGMNGLLCQVETIAVEEINLFANGHFIVDAS